MTTSAFLLGVVVGLTMASFTVICVHMHRARAERLLRDKQREELHEERRRLARETFT